MKITEINLWDAAKTGFTRKFIALSSYTRRGKFLIYDLSVHFKMSEKEKHIKPKVQEKN